MKNYRSIQKKCLLQVHNAKYTRFSKNKNGANWETHVFFFIFWCLIGPSFSSELIEKDTGSLHRSHQVVEVADKLP